MRESRQGIYVCPCTPGLLPYAHYKWGATVNPPWHTAPVRFNNPGGNSLCYVSSAGNAAERVSNLDTASPTTAVCTAAGGAITGLYRIRLCACIRSSARGLPLVRARMRAVSSDQCVATPCTTSAVRTNGYGSGITVRRIGRRRFTRFGGRCTRIAWTSEGVPCA